MAEHKKAYREANKEKLACYQKDYYRANKAKIAAKEKARRATVKEMKKKRAKK